MAAQPDMRQPRARPARRDVGAEVGLRRAGLVGDERRARVAVAELGADHLVALALLHVGHGDELIEVAPQTSPLAPSLRRIARGSDVALADRAALELVGIEQLRPA